jgi:malate synthase
MDNFVEQYASIIAAVFGGVGIKLLDKLFSHPKDVMNESKRIRDEIRKENTALRSEVDARRKDADEWRSKYWLEIEENANLVSQISIMQAELENLRNQQSPEDSQS